MTLLELYKRTHEMLFVNGADPNWVVGTMSHFGELETELDDLVVCGGPKRKSKGTVFVSLDGIPSHNPDPD